MTDERGTIKSYQTRTDDGTIFAHVWKDNKDVRMLSTFRSPPGQVNRKRKKPYGTYPLPFLVLIAYYNLKMNGVDKNDQATSYFRPTIRTRRATRNYLIHAFQIVAINTKIICKQVLAP